MFNLEVADRNKNYPNRYGSPKLHNYLTQVYSETNFEKWYSCIKVDLEPDRTQ